MRYGHIHKIYELVLRRVNHRKNTVEITLLQKYEVFFKEVGYYLRFYTEKISCRYYA